MTWVLVRVCSTFVLFEVRLMSQTLPPKNSGRDERHSAAWGKRFSMLLLLLIAEAAFAQQTGTARTMTSGKIAHDLAALAASKEAGETVQVIVQYKQAPQSEQVRRAQGFGGRFTANLSLVKGLALTVPVSALSALEAESEVESVTLDHPLKALDDYTDSAMNYPQPGMQATTAPASAWP